MARRSKKKITTDENLDPMVKYVSDQFVKYEAHWKPHFDLMNIIYGHWKQLPPAKKEEWMNNVKVPMTIEGEQTISPRLFSALFPNDAPVEIQVEGEASQKDGILIRDTIRHYFRIAKVQDEGIGQVSQTTLLGTGYSETGSWYVRKGYRPNTDTLTLIESRPKAQQIDFFEMFPHPAKLRIGDGLPLIRRHFVDAEAMKALGNFGNVENLQAALDSDLPDPAAAKRVDGTGKLYEVLQYWGAWDEVKTQENKEITVLAKPFWIIVINRKIKMRGIPNPYEHQLEPYTKTILFHDIKPGWFGVGVGEIGRSSQERADKIVNQRLDNVDFVLNKERIVNANDPIIAEKKLKQSKPGQNHYAADVNSIKFIDTPDVTSSAYKEEEIAKQDFREATGAVSQLMPAEEQHRTATGLNILQGAAGIRFRPVLRKMETDLIMQTAMFFFSNLQQFMTRDEWILITGDDGTRKPMLVKPEDIQRKVFFIPTGVSETLNKEVQVGQLLRFKELTSNDPTVNRQEINKRIADLMGFKDIDKLLTPQPQVQTASGLSVDEEQRIRQRLAEGATPDQIKTELLGQRPVPVGQAS